MRPPLLSRARALREAMVRHLERGGHLRDPRVRDALLEVARERFVPPNLLERAYDDEPLSIGHGQTISAPHMVAIMSQALDVRPGHRVLEVGTGSGYQAAVLAHLAGSQGRVVSVERMRALRERAEAALTAVRAQNVEVQHGDGSMGYPPEAPYDRILVTAAAPRIPPPLLEQLAPDGVLVLPVGDVRCQLTKVTRSGAEWTTEDLGACAFVPLRGHHGQAQPPFAS